MSEITAVTLGLNRKPNYFNAKYKIFLVSTFNPYITIYYRLYPPISSLAGHALIPRLYEGTHQGSNSSARLDALI